MTNYVRATPDDDVNTILCKAAENLEKFGWTKHKLKDRETGALCLMGAINATVNGNPNRFPEGEFNSNAIWTEVGQRIGFPGISAWNDFYKRTKEDVLGVLRKDC